MIVHMINHCHVDTHHKTEITFALNWTTPEQQQQQQKSQWDERSERTKGVGTLSASETRMQL